MDFLDEVKNDSVFKEMQTNQPMIAEALFNHYTECHTNAKKIYADQRNAIRSEYALSNGWSKTKELRHVASIPIYCYDWLQVKYGRKPSPEEITKWLKGHPEFWVITKW